MSATEPSSKKVISKTPLTSVAKSASASKGTHSSQTVATKPEKPTSNSETVEFFLGDQSGAAPLDIKIVGKVAGRLTGIAVGIFVAGVLLFTAANVVRGALVQKANKPATGAAVATAAVAGAKTKASATAGTATAAPDNKNKSEKAAPDSAPTIAPPPPPNVPKTPVAARAKIVEPEIFAGPAPSNRTVEVKRAAAVQPPAAAPPAAVPPVSVAPQPPVTTRAVAPRPAANSGFSAPASGSGGRISIGAGSQAARPGDDF